MIIKLIVNKNNYILLGESPENSDELPSNLDESLWGILDYDLSESNEPICPPLYDGSDDDTGAKFIDGQIVWAEL